ncbi:MAG TPA: carbon-nitrogen hydrolase family protein [Acidimicrobiales bacterium]
MGTVQTVRAAAVQMRCSGDRDDDLGRAADLVGRAAVDGARLVVLPELFASIGTNASMRAAAEPLQGPTVAWASELARTHAVHLVAGSFVERDHDQLYNTSCLLAPDGSLVAHYRKVHLFDIDVAGAATRESDTFSAGAGPVVAPLGEGGPGLGMTICYDLRFPELYRIEALVGAAIITVPAAFTDATGKPHWELLLRARAVEDQVGIVAAAQWGTSPEGIARHGHAMVVDSWGRVLADAGPEGDGLAVADLDLADIEKNRTRLPSLANRRPSTYRWPDGVNV